MKKLAIILDSFSAEEKASLDKYEDIYFLPLKTIVDGTEYLEGIDKTNEEMMKIVVNGKDLKTSQPGPVTIEKTFTTLSKEYENVIYFGISKGLSGTFNTAQLIAKDFSNIYIINNFLVGKAFIELALYLKSIETRPIHELIRFAASYGQEQPTYVIPMNNDAIIKGGRLGRAAAFVLEKLHSIPIIGYDNHEKLSKKMIKRSGIKAINYAIELVEKNIDKGVKGEYVWMICHTKDQTNALIAKKIIEDKGYKLKYEYTNGIIAIQTGDGAISIGVFRKLI